MVEGRLWEALPLTETWRELPAAGRREPTTEKTVCVSYGLLPLRRQETGHAAKGRAGEARMQTCAAPHAVRLG